jgi:hypothetical protein
MKTFYILLLIFMVSVPVGAANAGHTLTTTAQSESPAVPAAQPAPAPATTAPQQEVAPAQAPASAAPVPQPEAAPVPALTAPAPQKEAVPVPAWQPATSATSTAAPAAPPEGFMVQQLSHKEFATMDLKECTKCHKGSGVAPTHGSDQMREHSFLARRAGKNCTDCHNQQFCLDCHKGGGIDANLNISNYRTSYIPKTHRTDFREIHPIKALDNPQTCTKCHDTKYCSACHAKFRGEDLMIQSHRRAWSDLQAGSPGPAHASFTADQCQSCHPGGLLSKHVWSAEHATEARRNLQACQTCHSDGEICMTCHSARSGLKVNPHPRDWNSVKSRYSKKGGGRSCQKCHDTY